MELQHTLMARTPGIQLPAAAAPPAPSKRDAKRKRDQNADDEDEDDDEEQEEEEEEDGGAALESLWLRLSSQHEALTPYRDTALDSWHRRTVLSSGSGAMRNAGLRALNQSISSQVAALMRDPGARGTRLYGMEGGGGCRLEWEAVRIEAWRDQVPRPRQECGVCCVAPINSHAVILISTSSPFRPAAKFIKRTRLTLSACPRVLCEPPHESAAATTAADPHAAADVEAETAALDGSSRRGGAAAGASASEARDVLEEERDGETYDDAEFYQQLLKEFLDKGMEGELVGG